MVYAHKSDNEFRRAGIVSLKKGREFPERYYWTRPHFYNCVESCLETLHPPVPLLFDKFLSARDNLPVNRGVIYNYLIIFL